MGTRPLWERIAEQLRRAGARPVRVEDVLEVVGDQGFGLLYVILALPTLVPVLPPGTAAAIGVILALIGTQQALGARRPWLPARVRRTEVSPRAARFIRDRALPLLARLERRARPRLTLLRHGAAGRAAAVVVILMGLVMATPLPFLNTLPALAVLLIGIGSLKADGLLLLGGLGLGVGLAAVLMVAAIGGARLIPAA